MDRNKDGVVTIEEFIESCKKVTFMISLNVSLLTARKQITAVECSFKVDTDLLVVSLG